MIFSYQQMRRQRDFQDLAPTGEKTCHRCQAFQSLLTCQQRSTTSCEGSINDGVGIIESFVFADFLQSGICFPGFWILKLWICFLFLVGFGSQQLVHQHDVATCGHFLAFPMCCWFSLCHLVSTPNTLTPGWHKDVVKLTTLPIQGKCDPLLSRAAYS